MKRKMFSILTSSALLLQGASFPVLANDDSKFEPMEEVETLAEETLIQEANGILYEGKIGTAKWTIDQEGTLTIGEGAYHNDPENSGYTNNWPWRKYSEEIKKIDGTAKFVASGVYSQVFSLNYPDNKLISADLSGWDTSNVTDMGWIFYDCRDMTSLNLSTWDTSNVITMQGMFSLCCSLSSIDLSNFDTSKVTDMSYMFNTCSDLTSIDLSNFDTKNVTDMTGMFGGCKKLDSIDLLSWNTSNLTYTNCMFDMCRNLTSIDLSSWNTSNLINIYSMFSWCSKLSSVNLSDWDTSNITDISNLFYESRNLAHLNISGWNTTNISEISGLGENYNNLEEIKYNSNCKNFVFKLLSYLPEEILWDQNDEGPYLRTEIPSLAQGEIGTLVRSNKIGDNLIAYGKIGTSLWTLDQNGTLTIGEGRFENKDRDFGWPWRDYSDSIVRINGEADFIAQGDYSSAFQYLSNLKSANFSGWDTSDVTNINCMFNGCESLKELDLRQWDTSKVETMQWMFSGCTGLTTLDISSWDTSKVEDFSFIFTASDNLHEIKYGFKSEKIALALPSNAPENWKWYQDGKGPYTPSDIPSLSQGKVATLTKFEETVTPPIEDEDKNNSNSSEENKNPNEGEPGSSDPKEDDDSSTSNKNDTPTSSGGNTNNSKPAEDTKNPTLPVEDEDKNNPNSSVDLDPYTPTQTGDSSTVVVDLYIKNNKSLEGIHTEDGELPEEELRILETYLNTTPNYNPNDYSVTIVNASVTKNTGNNEKYNFELTVAITLKEESRINFVINKLEKKMKSEDAVVNENGIITLSLEDTETTPSYTIKEVGDKIIIEGLLVKNSFGSDNQIDESFLKGILDDEGYEVSSLDFTSNQSKNSTFILHDLTSLVTIEISTNSEEDKQPELVKPTRPSTGSSGGATSTKPSPTPSNPMVPSVVKKPTYRFFNTLTGEHFYTSSEAERDELMKDSRWNDEGQGWVSPEISNFLVYRLCNPNTGEHHYTTDKNEYDTLQTYGWKQEGVAFYSADPQVSDIAVVYRLFNPKANDAGSHHYTMNEQERNTLVNNGWRDEGIAWYELK